MTMDFQERREVTQPGRCASCLLSRSGDTTDRLLRCGILLYIYQSSIRRYYLYRPMYSNIHSRYGYVFNRCIWRWTYRSVDHHVRSACLLLCFASWRVSLYHGCDGRRVTVLVQQGSNLSSAAAKMELYFSTMLSGDASV